MTLNDLIQAATRLSYNLSGGDIPVLVNGKEVNITLMFADSNTPMADMHITEVQPLPTLPINYIDLGLSVKWADCNVGADNPKEYGCRLTYDDAVALSDITLPSKEEWEELMDKCVWEWKDKGYKVTGPNGNSIFLPAAGYRINSNLDGVGSYGLYWSYARVGDYTDLAWNLGFYLDKVYRDSSLRYDEFSVRAVKR